MVNWKKKALQHLEYVAATTVIFLGMNWLNELVFSRLQYSNGISWMFIPAGIRLLATLLFGLAGFEGLLLASIYLNFFHFVFPDEVRAWGGAVAGSLGPYLAYLFAKHWFDLRPRLQGLTVPRLLFTGVLCGVISPIILHAFLWVQTGLVDWPALVAMITGDIAGIVVVLAMTKGVMALAQRHAPLAGLVRRWTS
jgi:hypothetical protein